MSNIAATN